MKVANGLKVTAATAIALAVWACAGSTGASAAAVITADNIKTSGEEQKVYIDVSHLHKEEVMFGMATRGKKSDKITFKVSSWDIFEVNNDDEIVVDLSKLSNIKDNFVAIKTDGMEVPVIIKIPAVPKAAIATYNGAERELEFKTGTKKNNVQPASDYEWRTPYSSWNSPSDAQKLSDGRTVGVFDDFKYQGATLYIRTPGAPKAGITETADEKLKNAYDAGNIDKKLQVYDAGSFTGKEAKLNIAKQANGPSVAAKYTSGTLTLPGSSEYRVVTIIDGVKEIPDKLTSTSSRENVTIEQLLKVASTGSIAEQGILEVRTGQNDYKKKPASKWTRVPLSNANELKASNADGDVVNATVTDEDGNKVLEITKNADNISVKNISEDDYQIVVLAETPKLNTRYSKLKSQASIEINKDKNSQNVYIRKAGDSRTKTWVSGYIKIGTVKLP